jgi:beta-1,4-mannooligosaccharide/beta-1,4-mannosyl-N-acetylglucosamine phosphorylase
LREEGVYLCIARSKDLHHWERIYKSEPDNRNAVIFPRKIGGLYARLDRPFRRGYRAEHGYDIWISYSPDMEFWGRHKLVLSHYDVDWGHHKIGPSAPPVWTAEGWLTLFHGAEVDPGGEGWLPWINEEGPYPGKVYRTGVMLLDLNDPSKIIARREEPLMSAVAPYEMDPCYRPNTVFPCGMIEEESGGLKIYYGASDRHVALATVHKDDLLGWVLRKRKE